MEYPSTRSACLSPRTARCHSPCICQPALTWYTCVNTSPFGNTFETAAHDSLRLRLHLVGGRVVLMTVCVCGCTSWAGGAVRATFVRAPASGPVLDFAILHTFCVLEDPGSLLVDRLAGKCAIKTCLRVELECGTTPASRCHVELDVRRFFKIPASRHWDAHLRH